MFQFLFLSLFCGFDAAVEGSSSPSLAILCWGLWRQRRVLGRAENSLEFPSRHDLSPAAVSAPRIFTKTEENGKSLRGQRRPTDKTSKCQCPFKVQMWVSSALSDPKSAWHRTTGRPNGNAPCCRPFSRDFRGIEGFLCPLGFH